MSQSTDKPDNLQTAADKVVDMAEAAEAAEAAAAAEFAAAADTAEVIDACEANQNAEATCEVDPIELERQLMAKIDEAEARAAEAQDNLLRTIADLENFRKRALREKEELRKYGPAAFIEDLLPVIDNLQLGLDSAQQHHPEAKAVTDGFAMVVNQLQGVLAQYGVTAIEPKGGDAFDHNSHEAVSQLPSDRVEEGAVVALTRRGYRLHDRLLRPAGVVVSAGKAG